MTSKEIDEFKALCDTWTRNKIGLKCHASVQKKGVTITPKISGCPSEYQMAVETLVKKVAAKAIQYISSSLVFPVATDDQQDQMKGLGALLHDIVEPLLDHLYEFGFDSFDVQVQNHKKVFQMQYELAHLTFDKSGNWVRWDGSIWAGKIWAGRNKPAEGPDDIAKALSAFMFSQIQVV